MYLNSCKVRLLRYYEAALRLSNQFKYISICFSCSVPKRLNRQLSNVIVHKATSILIVIFPYVVIVTALFQMA